MPLVIVWRRSQSSRTTHRLHHSLGASYSSASLVGYFFSGSYWDSCKPALTIGGHHHRIESKSWWTDSEYIRKWQPIAIAIASRLFALLCWHLHHRLISLLPPLTRDIPKARPSHYLPYHPLCFRRRPQHPKIVFLAATQSCHDMKLYYETPHPGTMLCSCIQYPRYLLS
ncbi:hypothetical protein BDN72DRAFT_962325 [Pluteus cervinus]|uniref:Uncharacterized protein n=1 Tax=Pluteus cervinus TaxID=181527 RepID=A0ACD3AJ54_9AGAR|nr:hypothetical protein BDN72DRAFT_962325 [Pluteus cervinus]